MGYRIDADWRDRTGQFWGLMLNPWAFWQYAHNMLGAVQTGCFVMAAVGAFYLLDEARSKLMAGRLCGSA